MCISVSETPRGMSVKQDKADLHCSVPVSLGRELSKSRLGEAEAERDSHIKREGCMHLSAMKGYYYSSSTLPGGWGVGGVLSASSLKA